MAISITGGATLTGGASIGTGGSPSPSPGSDPNFSSVALLFNAEALMGRLHSQIYLVTVKL